MTGWGKTGVVIVAAMLSACAASPGMKMTEPAEVSDGVVVRVQPERWLAVDYSKSALAG